MIIVGLDPGYRQSAWLAYSGDASGEVGQRTVGPVLTHGIEPNADVRERLAFGGWGANVILVVEQMQLFSSNYGVGQEIFDSVFWSGRFVEAWEARGYRWDRILRSKVRGHLGASKGGDAAVRAALIDRFGPYKEHAIGTKKAPGPLYGIKADEWSALAIAVTYHDLHPVVDSELRPGVVAQF